MTLPVGKYRARAVGIDFGNTQGGNEFIAIAFECGPDRILETWYGYLSEKAAARTIGVLRLMGWTGNDLGTLALHDLPGLVQVDVRDDVDRDGNNRGTRIAFVNSLSGMTGQPMTENNRKALALRLRGLVAAAPVVAPVIDQPEPKPAPAPAEKRMRQPGEDEDLPY